MGVAAEVVLHARNTQQPPIPTRQLQPQMLPVAMPPQTVQNSLGQLGDQNKVSNLLSTLDAPTLHSLLGALQQNRPPPAQQTYSPSSVNPTDLAALLGTISHPNNPMPSIPSTYPQPVQAAQYGTMAPNPSLTSQSNLASLLTKNFGGEAQGQHQSQTYPQTQHIIDHLTKWRK